MSENMDSKSETPGDMRVWGSDIIADALREQDIPYVCLVPGASFRGLHDSIVNYLGNETPKILVCLHEEHAVSIAHGWAQVTNEPLAAIVHTNVGLMHATMTIFNVWCDRMPAIIIGASGHADAEKRRPWIEWIHTAVDLGALVRDYTKWDDQPGSAAAAVESIRRASLLSRTSPMGPVYVNLDIAIQEEWVEERPAFYDLAQYRPAQPTRPSAADVDSAYQLLDRAEKPLILIGRVSRDETAWTGRVRLAEAFNAGVFSIYNSGGGFPKSHPLHRGVARLTLDDATRNELAAADVILSLDWTDLGGTVEQVWPRGGRLPHIINCSNDFHLHRGWSRDYHRLQPATLRIATTPDAIVSALLDKCRQMNHTAPAPAAAHSHQAWRHETPAEGPIDISDLAAVFNNVSAAEKITLVSRPIGWPQPAIRVEHPLDFLGSKGGEGLGAGPGMAVGAALAVRDRYPDRLVVSILGDGDFLMGATALWTAAAEGIPLLVIVANNHAYHNDVKHQDRIARQRGRPVANKWIGQRIDEPAPDLASLARSLGLEGAGLISDIKDLPAAIKQALDRVRAGSAYVLDIEVRGGYAAPVAGKE